MPRRPPDPVEEFLATEPTLTARSVVLSTLLGTDPPVMPIARLVQVGGLFGFEPGAIRTSVTRMTGRGELLAAGARRYELGAQMRVRQARQQASRAATTVTWDGAWTMAVVRGPSGTQDERRQRRIDLALLRLARLRDGVYLRPDNLPTSPLPEVRDRVNQACRWFRVQPDEDDAELVHQLWDLDGWIARADVLRKLLNVIGPGMRDGDTQVLGPGFVLSAAVLRHLQSDPLLPRELWPRRWNGERLRADYDTFDAAYRSLLAQWWRHAGTDSAPAARQ